MPPLLLAAFVAGCGGEATPPAGTDMGGTTTDLGPIPSTNPDVGGVITSLTVADEFGDPLTEYFANHLMRVTVGIRATRATHQHSLFVGLVQQLPMGSDHAMAVTCQLGAFEATYAQDPKDPMKSYTFTKDFNVPESCIPANPKSTTYNLWVGMNPSLETNPGSGANERISDSDYNTQFFTAEGLDLDGQSRNAQCIGPDGKPGCVIDLEVLPSAGSDVEFSDLKSESSVAVLPSNCTADFTQPPVKMRGEIRIFGSEATDENTMGKEPANALAKAGGSVSISYTICPAGPAPAPGKKYADYPCAPGTTRTPLKFIGSDPGDTTFDESMTLTSMVAGEPVQFTHELFLPPMSDACLNVTGDRAAKQKWQGYGTFVIRACVDSTFKEEGNGNEEANDNCLSTPIRFVVTDPKAPGKSKNYSLNAAWNESWGGDVVGLKVGFGTNNELTLSGATSSSFGTAAVSGWVSFPIVEVKAAGNADVAIVGSAVNASLDVFGNREWGYSQEIPEYSMNWEQKYSKQRCGKYNYGVAGLGLNAAICATGEAGIKTSLTIKAKEAAGDPPFDSATKIGEVLATATPYTNLQLNAKAWADAGVAKGSINGDLSLLNVSLPVVGTLRWGLVSLDPVSLVVTGDVTMDIDINTLKGSIRGEAEVRKPSWCSCGRWCPGYPCATWGKVWGQELASYPGFGLKKNLFKLSNQLTLL